MIRSIRAKLVVGFFALFSVFFVILNQLVADNIASGNRKLVTDNLIELKMNSNAFIRQSYLTHHFASDELYFGQIARETVEELRRATSGSVGMYATDGKLLFASDPGMPAASGEDLNHALQGETAYTLTYAGGEATALFAYPVYVDGVKVGILRFSKDFTLLYEQAERLQRTIFLSSLGVFAAAFLMSILLSRNIAVPLVKLSAASAEVMKGNLNVRPSITRKDEIGRLADNFNGMIGTIRSQIATIEQDRDRLERVNEERKRFYDNVTHELKTPLTIIQGYAETILAGGERDSDFFAKGMNHIVDESKRLHALVVDLLEKSKPTETSRREIIDVGEVLLSVCEAMKIKARSRYRKTIACDAEEGLRVVGRSDRLRQLFINLLDNAIKYGRSETDIAVSAKHEADRVLIAVDNASDPIDPGHLAQIFEPFYRAEETEGSTESAGLGLGICKEIAEEHGGTISLTSVDGRTIVEVDLPSDMQIGEERI